MVGLIWKSFQNSFRISWISTHLVQKWQYSDLTKYSKYCVFFLWWNHSTLIAYNFLANLSKLSAISWISTIWFKNSGTLIFQSTVDIVNLTVPHDSWVAADLVQKRQYAKRQLTTMLETLTSTTIIYWVMIFWIFFYISRIFAIFPVFSVICDT